MFVIKRNGTTESVQFDKITNRLKKLIDFDYVDPILITQKISSQIYNGITTTELDTLSARICMSMSIEHPNFGILGARIAISNHQKNTDNNFSNVVEKLANNKDIHDNPSPLISQEIINIVKNNQDIINNMIDYERDYLLDFFGFKTLEKSYLLKINIKKDNKYKQLIVERPQHLFMRVALAIHGNDLNKVKQFYDNISLKKYTHATPTLFNAGTNKPACSSCFLLGTHDSVDGIFKTMADCAQISKWSGGIGLHISNIRSKGSYIRKTNGISSGIMPMLKVYNDISRYINQCFTPETIIYTKFGAKEIQTITRDDEVLTLSGEYKPVLSIFINNVNKEILKIKTEHSDNEICVTKEHQIYVIRNKKGIFIPALELKNNDILCFPLVDKNEYPTLSDYTQDQVRLYGIILMSSNVVDDTITITINDYNITTYNFVVNMLKTLNINFDIVYNNNQRKISWKINDNMILNYLSIDDIYKNKIKTKHISKKFMNIPLSYSASLLKGILETMPKCYDVFSYPLKLYVNNALLLEDIRFCFLKFGILLDDNKKNNKQYLNIYLNNFIREQFKINLNIPNNVKENKHFVYTRVKEINKVNYEGHVYDLNIQDNHNYLTQMGLVHNSGKRNGSFAVYIELYHADIFEFLNAKKNQGAEEERARDLFYALWVCDLFMKRVEKGELWSLMDPDMCPGLSDVFGDEFDKLYTNYENQGKYIKQIPAREIWEAIISSQVETGTPYILFKDHVNRKSNQNNIGVIKSSNLCVSPETMVLTKSGYFKISELANKDIEVWNGKEWSSVTPLKTGENQQLLDISFSNGITLQCTPYHKFYIQNQNNEIEIIEAQNLQKNMNLQPYVLPDIMNFVDELQYPYEQGLYCANNTDELIILTNKNKSILQRIKKAEKSSFKIKLPILELKDKMFVPINYSVNTKLRWLEGYLDLNKFVSNYSIHIISSNKDLLTNIFYMLQTLNINTTISNLSTYNNLSYRLNIEDDNIIKLKDLKLNPSTFEIEKIKPISKINYTYTRIIEIKNNNQYSDTYCFEETKEHKGMFNGILTGQCAEIVEYSGDDEYGTCNLSSVCLPSILKNPSTNFGRWKELLFMKFEDKNLITDKIEYYFNGKLLLYSKDDCVYCKLLKKLLTDCNIKYTEITPEEADAYRSITNTLEYNTVPQLFVEFKNKISFLGGYHNSWEFLKPLIDYQELYDLSYELIINLNKVIDINYYPTIETKKSNFKHRPLGLGVQGLGDLFLQLKLPFDCEDAKKINKNIFETIYFGALNSSLYLAKNNGPYETFKGSHLSNGKFQFDLWGIKKEELSGLWDWDTLRNEIINYGVKNSLVIALMPTASTSQIMGSYCESIEPLSSNLYTRRTMAGEFIIINPYLVQDLIALDLWNEDIKLQLQYDKGSIQYIKEIPQFLREIYKTAYEIPQKSLIQMSADRGPFVCQSQSLNLFFDKPEFKKITAALFLGWKLGLKTGSYYIRTKPAILSQNFGIDIKKEEELKKRLINNDDNECLSCGA